MTGLTSKSKTAVTLRTKGANAMSLNDKGRADCHQATPHISNAKRYFTQFTRHFKTVVLTLAAWGWFPIGLAERFTQKGERDYE